MGMMGFTPSRQVAKGASLDILPYANAMWPSATDYLGAVRELPLAAWRLGVNPQPWELS
jgi:hypothetical protein